MLFRARKLRHSLLARLLASSVLVAVCSITATAWLAVQGTSESIGVERGQTLTVDTDIHDTLLGYAATHPEWDEVQSAIDELAAETGRRIALTTENRRPIADSAAEGTPIPARTSSVVDPLAVDLTLAAEDADRIDPRAVGPFALSEEDRSRLRAEAESSVECFVEYGLNAEVTVGHSGRPAVETPDGGTDSMPWVDCGLDELAEPTDSERDALEELNRLIDECVRPYGLDVDYRIDAATGEGTTVADPLADPRGGDVPVPSPVPEEGGGGGEVVDPEPTAGVGEPSDSGLGPDSGSSQQPSPSPATEDAPQLPSGTSGLGAPPAAEIDPRAAACVSSSRREQLDPYVAPPALLFIGDPAEDTASGLELSREGLSRISWLVLLVLLVTVAVSGTVATRLVRPVRALTGAVQRMHAGDGTVRVAVRDSGEIGQLATAFNEMSEHLHRLEEQRKAMVSDVSHELRTPLSNLRGWLEAAQDGVAELGPQQMAMLVEQTLLLQRIIDDLQELALADAGKLRLAPEPVDAGELVEQAAAGHRLPAESAGLQLVTETSGDLPLLADRARLLQAVGNLVENALRHTPAPGRITVRAYRSGDDALIEVADTGVGIAEEDLPHVFDRFWRAEKSRNRKTGGSGLGLAIVRNLVELHGGDVTAASTPGEGTTFTIRLPLESARS